MSHSDRKRREGQRLGVVAELGATAPVAAAAVAVAVAGHVLQVSTLAIVVLVLVDRDEVVVGELAEDKVCASSAGTAALKAEGTVLH
jgi:hypothetical protein